MNKGALVLLSGFVSDESGGGRLLKRFLFLRYVLIGVVHYRAKSNTHSAIKRYFYT